MAEIFQRLFAFICQHSDNAHWIISGCILLAGFNVPISEDLLVLAAGAIAGTCFMQGCFVMYGCVFTACLVAGWETYWIGRLLGSKLLQRAWFCQIFPPQRMQKIQNFYHKYGLLTFVIVRFIPGGVRNALFLSSGLTQMPFSLFFIRDSIGCFFAVSALFTLGHFFGSNAQVIFYYMELYEMLFAKAIALFLIAAILFFQMRKKSGSSLLRQDLSNGEATTSSKEVL